MIRITPKEAQGMYDAYNKVYAPPEEEKPAAVEEPATEPETSTEK